MRVKGLMFLLLFLIYYKNRDKRFCKENLVPSIVLFLNSNFNKYKLFDKDEWFYSFSILILIALFVYGCKAIITKFMKYIKKEETG